MKVLFTGGGTLGSVTPLLAVAEEVRRVASGATFVWVGTRTGPERALVAQRGMRYVAFPSGKLRRYADVRNVRDVFIIAWAFVRAIVFLTRERPDVVVGAGSYVQVPVMLAACVLRTPIVTHQLDARSSLANTIVRRCATARTATFGAAGIGVPVRAAVRGARGADVGAAKHHFGFSGERPVLLVLGGGTGAAALNALVWAALPALSDAADVIHVTGRGKGKQRHGSPPPAGRGGEGPALRSSGEAGGWGGAYRQFEFLADDMVPALVAADLVMSRAGMGTIAELGYLGKPTVLIPIPESHQEDNAHALAERGAAEVWDERGLTGTTFAARTLALLRNARRCAALGGAIASVFPHDAAEKLAAIVVRATRR